MAPWMVLIGPIEAGKTTLGERVASATRRRFVDLDDVADPFYAEVGWSWERLRARAASVGRLAAENEFQTARAHAVERAVAEYPEAVVAFGAGHSSFTERRLLDRVQVALRPVEHVVFVLPSSDLERSIRLLRQRSLHNRGESWLEAGHDFLHEWVHDPANRLLATVVFYTEGEEPDESAARLLTICR
jgi:shikimate kinase